MAMGMAISLCGLGSAAVHDRNTGCILARWTVTFKYDPFGRRIYKSSSSGTSVFAYDDDNLAEETNAAPPHPRGICKSVKLKNLEMGQFVSN